MTRALGRNENRNTSIKADGKWHQRPCSHVLCSHFSQVQRKNGCKESELLYTSAYEYRLVFNHDSHFAVIECLMRLGRPPQSADGGKPECFALTQHALRRCAGSDHKAGKENCTPTPHLVKPKYIDTGKLKQMRQGLFSQIYLVYGVFLMAVNNSNNPKHRTHTGSHNYKHRWLKKINHKS